MPMYKCEWPNGDVSFVLASDVDDAILQLDELGDAEPRMVKRIREFLIDLKPNRQVLEANERARQENREEAESPWELAGFGEGMLDPEAKLLPSEERTLRRLRKHERAEESESSEPGSRSHADRDVHPSN